MPLRKCHLFGIALAFLAGAASGATIHVPGDEPTIAAGLAAASAGDTVLVACGYYTVQDLQMIDGVTLRSAGGRPDCAILSGQSAHRIMSGVGLSEATRIEGFTFRWARAEGEGEFGAALYLEDAHLQVRDCDFLNNVASWGGAVAALDSRAVFEDCRFAGNRSTYYGGAVWCDYVAPVSFLRCDFDENHSGLGGGALSCYGFSNLMLVDCHFRGNYSTVAGALHAITSSPQIEHCSFVGNEAYEFGGAIVMQGGDTQLIHCTLVANRAPLGSALDYRDHEGSLPAIPNLSCCILAFGEDSSPVSCMPGDAFVWDTDIYGHAAGDWIGCLAPLLGKWGNISKDPQFCSHEDLVNLHLQSDSPCAASCESGMGAFPPACGEQASEPATWSRIKRRY